MTAAERTRRIDSARERGRKSSPFAGVRGSVTAPASSPKAPSELSIVGTEAGEIGEQLLNPNPTSEIAPIKKAFESTEKKVSETAAKLPVLKQLNEASEKTGQAVKAAESTAEALAKGVSFLTNTKNWARLGKILGGAIVILIGLYMLLRSSGAKSPAVIVKGARALRG